jgi:hypothetical protein
MLKNWEIKKEFKSKYIKGAEKQLNLTKLDPKDRRDYEKHLEAMVINRKSKRIKEPVKILCKLNKNSFFLAI